MLFQHKISAVISNFAKNTNTIPLCPSSIPPQLLKIAGPVLAISPSSTVTASATTSANPTPYSVVPQPSLTRLKFITAQYLPGSICLTMSNCSGTTTPSQFHPIVRRMTTITTSAATISSSAPITASSSSAVNTYLNHSHSRNSLLQHWNSCR